MLLGGGFVTNIYHSINPGHVFRACDWSRHEVRTNQKVVLSLVTQFHWWVHHDSFSQSIVPRGGSREKSVKFGNFRVAGTICLMAFMPPSCVMMVMYVHVIR